MIAITDEEILEVAKKIAETHRFKTFDCYTSQDIEQEVYVIIYTHIKNFDMSKVKDKNDDPRLALEKFLNRIVSNRLKNLYRDRFLIRIKESKNDSSEYDHQKRINLMHPIDISGVSEDSAAYSDDTILDKECRDIVLENLDEEYKEILDCIEGGEKVTPYYKIKLRNKIEEILRNHNYHV